MRCYRLFRKYKKLVFALVEQAAYSIGNLFLSIYLVNNFSGIEAGGVLFALSIAVFSAGVCGAFFVEPALVFDRSQGKVFVASSEKLVLISTIVIVMLQIPVWLFCTTYSLEVSITVGIVILTGLFFALRKGSNVSEIQEVSVFSSLIYFSSLVLLLLIFPDEKEYVLLSIFTSLVLGILGYLVVAKLREKRGTGQSVGYCVGVILKERSFVSKSLMLAFLYWLPMNGIYLVAAIFSAEEVISDARKYLNLFMPIFQFNSVFAVYYLSRLSVSEKSHVNRLFSLGLICNVFYMVLVMIGGESLYGYLYQDPSSYSYGIVFFLSVISVVIFFLNKTLAKAKLNRELTAIGKAYLMCVPVVLLFSLYSSSLTVMVVISYIFTSYIVVAIMLHQFVNKKVTIR